ncbi:MAG: type II secretion system F family protein [Candidatus Eremiobacterota bacterium]
MPKGPPDQERTQRCRTESVVLFTRQLATMLRAGIPITRALDTLQSTSEDPALARVLVRTNQRVSEGYTLSRALAYYPRVFNPLYLAMVGVGETSGDLEGTLDRLATWLERDQGVGQKVRAALVYPAFVLSMTGILTLVIFHTALPGFVKIFREMRLELPLMTRMLVLATDSVRNPGTWLVGLGLLVGGAGWFRATLASKAGASRLYAALMTMPLIGSLVRNGSVARFASAMEAMIATGVPLVSCLKNAGQATGNPAMEQDLERAVGRLTEGGYLSEHFGSHPELYPPTFAHMIRAGEEASALEPMFARLSAYYDQEVNYQIESVTAALEPLLMGLVSLIVGFVVIALFLPMYGYLGRLGS